MCFPADCYTVVMVIIVNTICKVLFLVAAVVI